MSDDNFALICSQIPNEVLDQSSENSLLLIIFEDGQVTLTPSERSPLKDHDQNIQLFSQKKEAEDEI
jgi:hypothetical protein